MKIMNGQELLAILVFIGVYVLIVTEKVHRTVAAMIGASVVLFSGIIPWNLFNVILTSTPFFSWPG